jgi:hypothetical protein
VSRFADASSTAPPAVRGRSPTLIQLTATGFSAAGLSLAGLSALVSAASAWAAVPDTMVALGRPALD